MPRIGPESLVSASQRLDELEQEAEAASDQARTELGEELWEIEQSLAELREELGGDEESRS